MIGSSAIDETGSLLDFDYREVRVAHAILKQARKTILVADHSKFERRAPVEIGQLSDLDVFVTDQMPAGNIVSICREAEIELIVAKESSISQVSG